MSPTRRAALKSLAAGIGGTCLTGPTLLARRLQQPSALRRSISIAGRRIRVIDGHAHCAVDVSDIVKGTALAANGGAGAADVPGPERIATMDRQGVDVEVIGINGYWWYRADRDLARAIVRAQNERVSSWVAAHPTRFAGLASVALQFPDLAAEQLEDGVKRLGLRGVSIGGHVNGEDLSQPKYDPFWAKASELGVLVLMHPAGAENLVKPGALSAGRGDLVNIIGNPLETTYFLSRMIFDGTFDRFPGVRILASHAGGYLPSYLGRTEAACAVRANANCANRKKPSEYLKTQVFIDTMVFSTEGLRHLVEEVGATQLTYGTDVPYNWPVTVDLVLDAPFLNDADKARILGGTLQELLRLPA